MKDNKFIFCPDCGSKKIQTLLNGRKWLCSDCGFDLYNNVASAVGVIIENSKGEILLEKRAKDPRKGYLAFPGGFCEPDECAEVSAVRECREEIGLEITELKFLCSFPNTYVYRDIIYKTCDIFFTAKVCEGSEIKMDESEVSEYVWVPADTVEDIEKIPLAFESAKNTLLRRIGK